MRERHVRLRCFLFALPRITVIFPSRGREEGHSSNHFTNQIAHAIAAVIRDGREATSPSGMGKHVATWTAQSAQGKPHARWGKKEEAWQQDRHRRWGRLFLFVFCLF